MAAANIDSSEDFDTDLNDEEKDTDDAALTEKERSRDRKSTSQTSVLQSYKLACLKHNLAPRSVLMKQLGQVSVNLRNRLLSWDDVIPIVAALKNLCSTQLGRAGVETLVKGLCRNTALHTLYLDSNGLQGCDERQVAYVIMKIHSLRELYLGNNKLGSPSITYLALALEEVTCVLTVLDLQYNHIRREAVARLIQSQAKNTSLHTVNLSWNGLRTYGCVALKELLAVNTSLTHLDISHSGICYQDIQLIAPGLRENGTLRNLKMCFNPITTNGAVEVVNALISSKVSILEEIYVRGIPVHDGFVILTKVLEEQNSTKVIYDFRGTLLPLRNVKPWPQDGRDIGFYKPVLVLFEYMKLDGMRLITLFEFLDHHKRRQISRKDLRRGIHELNIPFSEHDLKELMRCLDADKDGFISFKDLLRAYRDHYYALRRRRDRARVNQTEDRAVRDLWAILRRIIRKKKPVSHHSNTSWYTLVQEKWRI
ncbi:leucine-rich repeat-containing protein 74a-like [Plakobranchus ocellatus]|uniref:Leucine-rich repeat-containing protein 74a-like n=1 Tax=Plakobranchus ocellatus TaxID=259542 RepID=A0AAV3Y5R6_9GAST|nr:leucine-rich repeat-containing protein 74a-like [Plakobranchus ocellatus]